MNREQFFQTILPHLGGADNISRQVWKGSKLCVTVKDVGALQLDALEGIDAVASVELNRGRVTVSAQGLENQEENKMANNAQIAADILAAIGGKENVTSATHCMTRLRLTLKDASQAPENTVKNISGVLGVVQAGGQYQIIVGQNVPKVYTEFCKLTGLTAQEAIKENLDGPKEKLTPKKIGGSILGYMSGSMTPMIPIMMAAGMFKTVLTIFTDLLHILPQDSSIYIILDFMYDAGMYFMPIYIGYFAAKKIGMSPNLGMYLGGILIAPDFLNLVTSGAELSLFGLPIYMKSYAQSFLPVLLTVAVGYLFEKLFKKIVPDVLSTIFVPMCTILCTTPIALIIAAPIGYMLGDYIGAALIFLGDHAGFVGLAIIAGLWEYLVMTGIHGVLLMPAMTALMSGGTDPVMFVAAKCATFAAIGMALGTFLRMKHKGEKATAGGMFVSGLVGGVTEPVLYGIGLKYKRPFIAMSIGAAIGGAWNGITGVVAGAFAPSNFLGVLAYSNVTSANLVNGTIGCCIALIASAILTFLFGYSTEEAETGKPRA